MERKLLKILLKNEHFHTLRDHLTVDFFSPLGRIIYDSIAGYFERDPNAESCDVDILRDKLLMGANPKHADQIKDVLDNIIKEEVSDVNVLDLTLNFLRNRIGSELGAKLLIPHKQDKKEIDKLLEQYITLENKINGETEERNEIKNGIDVQDLLSPFSNDNRIPLYPRSLNDVLGGGAIRGQNILVFGRPEVGKTLFLVNLIGGFLRRGLRVFYAGNEDPISAIAPRILTRIVEMPIEEIRANAADVRTKADERGYRNLYLKDITPGTWNELRKDIEVIEPDVVIVDQWRHLYCGNLTKVEQMERAATEARNVAKEYNILSIGTTQAGDSADGKLVLEMGDVDFSNTGMQGAVDLLVGIGLNDDYDRLSRRMLSLSKNKISGKHEYIPVVYNIPINKVESLT